MESETLEKLRNEVLALFNSLIMFTAEEHAQRIEQIKIMPQDGLEKLLEVFQDAFAEQTKQMRDLFVAAPNLPKKIYVALRQNGVLTKPEAEPAAEKNTEAAKAPTGVQIFVEGKAMPKQDKKKSQK